MSIFIQTIVVFLILLISQFAVPKLQPVIYTAIFFFFLFFFVTTFVFPFAKMYTQLFHALPEPYAKLLIGSAILYYISSLIAKHFEEAGYASLAGISHLAVKITILTLWIQQTTSLIDTLSSIISK